MLLSVKTVVHTYCHDQFKRMFVHPHWGLILLHHGGANNSAENLKIKNPGKQSNIPSYVINPADLA